MMGGLTKGELESAMLESGTMGHMWLLYESVVADHGLCGVNELVNYRTPDQGNNIVHIAVRHGHRAFFDRACSLCPVLLRQKNNYGNTPLHEAAAFANILSLQLLSEILESYSSTSSFKSDLFECNNDGETPFHVALRTQNLTAVAFLFSYVKKHPQILLMKTNLRKETPLHLYVRYCTELNDNGNVVSKQKLLYQIIDANFPAIFELDWEGFNPLMRASQYGCVTTVWMLLKYKQLMECRDSKGRNFMHHLRLRIAGHNARDSNDTMFICMKILNIPGVNYLTCSQDQDGNTPLHLAILDRDFELAQLILEQYKLHLNNNSRYAQAQANAPKESILKVRNTEGKTVLDLISSEQGIPPILKDLMVQARRGRMMSRREYEAAIKFDLSALKVAKGCYYDSSMQCQNKRGENILHIAMEYGDRHIPFSEVKTFIEKAIERYPELMYQKDCNDDTPLHLAARLLNDAAIVLLDKCQKMWHSRREGDLLYLKSAPWKVKNSRGHTPFHEAARTGNRSGLNKMTEIFQADLEEAVADINEYGENVLHLIARYARESCYADQEAALTDVVEPGENPFHLIARSAREIHNADRKNGNYLRAFMDANDNAAYVRDNDGFSPIMRAAQYGQLWLIIDISQKFPRSINIRDYNGRNMLHHLVMRPSLSILETLSCTYKLTGGLISSQDDDGNTPLHLAILHQNFEVAEFLIRHHVKPRLSSGMKQLMEIKNNDGKSVTDLITWGKGIHSNLKELTEPVSRRLMDDKLYEAATKGNNMEVFSPFGYCLIDRIEFYCPARDGSGVLHIALRHHHIPFIENLIYHEFGVIYLKDSKGDTLLHLAAGLPSNVASTFFKICHNKWTAISKDTDTNFPPPWTVRNSKGNTYLHEAARLCNYEVIVSEFLNGIDDIKDVNDRGETILHVLARYATYAAKEVLEKGFKIMMPLVYMRDYEGFTPVLRAAQYGRLGMARLLIQYCPQSVDIRDNKDRTILHYLRASVVDLVDDLRDTLPVWKDLFRQPGVDVLRFAQDEDGNTPLHLTIIDANFSEAKYLMELCVQSENKQELYIENNDRTTIFDLLSAGSRSNIPAVKELKQLLSRNNIMERQLRYRMKDELYTAAKHGDIQIFSKDKVEDYAVVSDIESVPPKLDIGYFCSQTAGGSNIIHIALKDEMSNNAEQFIKTALQQFPYLSMRPDSNGDTPLHLAAKWKDGVSLVKSLIDAAMEFLSNLDENKKAFHVAPWAVKNYKGNFPIHEALQSGNFEAAYTLLNCDVQGASLVNDSGETPLHAFANNGFSVTADQVDKFVEALMQKGNLATFAAYTQDSEGRTPLMSAAKSGRLQVVGAILKHHPQSAYLRDPKGRTFLHVLRFTGEDVDENLAVATGLELLKIPEADAQRLVQDNDGNTPLHCAIKNGNSTAALLLTRRCLDCQNRAELGLMNKEGDTIPYLIASRGDVPSEIIELMQKKAPEAVCLNRSSYGINKIEMKESANALSVVAALLATITFAAAFQVPGGFGEDGFPILSQKPAFAIFSVANTIAMCSSMLCLFLLLWVMGIGKTHGSLMILDASIFLLRLSFYLTLVTFMTGMFVVTVEKSLWLAILVCVCCFLTFLLTRRSLILLVSKHGGRTVNGMKSKLKKL